MTEKSTAAFHRYYGFVIDGLVRDHYHKSIKHDHAHTWTAYGIVTGREG